MHPLKTTAIEDPGEALVSVVTVSYNGGHLLSNLLDSLRRQTYRNFETVVVDNGSADGSVELLRSRYPEVRVLQQSENAGFAGGNNAGIRATKGPLVALINNDAVADPRWLEELVRAALSDPGAAAFSSKILFYQPFLPIHLTVESTTSQNRRNGDACRELGVLVGEASEFEESGYPKPIFKEGFSQTEWVQGRAVRRTATEATLYLPIRDTGGEARLRLVVSGGPAPEGRRIQVRVGVNPIAELVVDAEFREHSLYVPAEVVAAEAFDVINNAGTHLSADGEAADRGIYEADLGQYDRPEDIEAFCGAAVLLRRSALEAVGLFDSDFFMYYEDTDLSWRLRAHGYRIRYQPRSEVRHLHASSSVEWSPLFTFYTARNKVLMIAKNGRPRALLHACTVELRRLFGLLWYAFRTSRSPRTERIHQELTTRLRLHRSLLGQIPRALLKRTGVIAH